MILTEAEVKSIVFSVTLQYRKGGRGRTLKTKAVEFNGSELQPNEVAALRKILMKFGDE
jgi:hypothetical protein